VSARDPSKDAARALADRGASSRIKEMIVRRYTAPAKTNQL